MAEYKLSYTANEIDEKLGKIDGLVQTVNGISPDENGNVVTVGKNVAGKGAEIFNDYSGKTVAYGDYSHAEGVQCSAFGDYSHAENHCTVAYGSASHAEGRYSVAVGRASHAEGEGKFNTIYISGDSASKKYTYEQTYGDAIKEGQIIICGDNYAKIISCNESTKSITVDKTLSAEAALNRALATVYSHAAYGSRSHAEGYLTMASGHESHAEGYGCTAYGDVQHVQGKYNKISSSYAHIVGNGTDEANRSNAHTIDWYGNAWFAGDVTVGEDKKKLSTLTSWKELEDRPFYEKGDILSIEFDGNINGNAVVDLWGITYYKVSDYVPTEEDLVVLTSTGLEYIYCGESESAYKTTVLSENGYVYIDDNWSVIFALKDNAEYDGVAFPEAGIYFYSYNENDYIKAIRCNDVITKVTELKTLDEKYLPESIDSVIIRSSTEGSTKKFKITVDDSGTIAATEVTE